MDLDFDFDDLDGPPTIPPRTFKFKPKPLKIKTQPRCETPLEPPVSTPELQNSEPREPENAPNSRKNQDEKVGFYHNTDVDDAYYPFDDGDGDGDGDGDDDDDGCEDGDEDEDEDEDMTAREIDGSYNSSIDSDFQLHITQYLRELDERYKEVRVEHRSTQLDDAPQANEFNLKNQTICSSFMPFRACADVSENRRKKFVTEDADFVIDLPDELLHKIFSYGSLREVVRRSILSRRWRYLSAYNPVLRFNYKEMFITEPGKSVLCTAKQRPCISFEDKVRRTVNNYIRLYRGEKIDSFEFSFCLCSLRRSYFGSHYGDNDVDGEYYGDNDVRGYNDVRGDIDVDGWIKFALSKEVESLTLFGNYLFDGCQTCYCYRMNCVFGYIIRIELFDGISMRLKHLKLTSCLLGPNFTNQLSSLETLSLDNVGWLASNLESMFPFLGKLKTLEITNSFLPKKLSLVSLPLLQKFLVYRPRLLKEIELSNLYLDEFKCLVGDGGLKCNLSGAPNLTSLSYVVYFSKMDLLFTDFPCQELTNLNLFISYSGSEHCIPPLRYVWTLSRVTHLNLQFFEGSYFSVVRVMAILKAFPTLRAFRLIMNCTHDLEEEAKIEHDLSYVPENLTEVSISHFRCTKFQMQFAFCLLKYSSALEKLSILLAPERDQLRIYEGKYCGITCRFIADTLQQFDTRNILDVQISEEIPSWSL